MQYNPIDSDGRLRSNVYQSDREPQQRIDLGGRKGSSTPMLWDGVGYPREGSLDFRDFWLRYERQGFARGIIDKPAHDTWQQTPEILDESEQEGEEETSFEKEVRKLLDGDYLRRKPVHRMDVSDRLAQLGEFSIMVLGFAGTEDLSEPVGGVQSGEPQFSGPEDLEYVAVFGQDRVESISKVSDMSDPRFRLPESYEVITQNTNRSDITNVESEQTTTEEIHWTRVIHVPEGTLEDDIFGTPKLKPIWNNLLNVEKILAGSAEGYWRGGYQGLVIRPPEGPSGEPIQFEDGSDGLQKEIRRWTENFQRTIATTGQVDTLDTSLENPDHHLTPQIKEMSASIDMPMTVLMGNETGERATSEDKSMWHEHISSRRNKFGEPVILRPFIQRLVDVGVLPEPTGDGFWTKWPPLDEMSEEDEWSMKKVISETLDNLSGGDPERLMSRAELRTEVLEMNAGYGSETNEDFEQEGESIEDIQSEMADEVNQDDDETSD